MYYYRISEGAYADYSEVILIHKKNFNKEEFRVMIDEAMSNCEFVDYLETADYCCEHFGFKKLEVNQSVSLF
jgi:hypothetical protein